ncbi:MAG: DNA repair protein RecO [Ruminococcaceae bacterium]|nr:DNA repair protein RecO [Oscillospiraceae bacterium]
MRESIEGLILSQTILKESDKFLTVLTAKYGKISVYANHVRNIKRGSLVYSMPLQYCRFIINRKGDSYNLVSGDVIHSFLDLNDDLVRFSLAQYVLDIARELSVENNDESEMLQLALNTLFMIQKGTLPLPLIKATFEFRAMAQSGYMPELHGCDFCSKDGGEMFLDIMNGRLICNDCQRIRNLGEVQSRDAAESVIVVRISPSMLKGLRYVLSSEAKRIFSYSIAEDELSDYADVCEKYILNHLERGFDTLDFYKEVSSMPL